MHVTNTCKHVSGKAIDAVPIALWNGVGEVAGSHCATE